MAEDMNEIPVETLPEVDVSPLQVLMQELHEIYLELIKVGFSERTAAFMVALQMESSLAAKYAVDAFEIVEFDDEDDDDFDL